MLASLAAAEYAAATIKQQTHIPAQGLSSALEAFARERSLQLVYATDEVGSLQTSGAAGNLSASEALAQLLQGTGLSYQFIDEKTVTVQPLTGAAGQNVGALKDRAVDIARADQRSTPEEIRHAQAEGAPAGSSPVSSNGVPASNGLASEAAESKLEEIVVSAQKRGDERLREVPVPVSVIDTGKLAENGQLLLRDYYSHVPSLIIAPTYLAQQSLTIRGIAANGADPTVGIVVDDVPFGMSVDGAGGNVVPDIDPSDLARIEVLRGPQGALFGANSMGGLLKFVTKDPSTAGYSGRIETGLTSVKNGDGPGYNFRAAANVPLNDALAVRVSGYLRHDTGYIDNPLTGQDGVNDAEARGGQLTALWRLSDAVSLRLGAIYQHIEADGVSEVEVQPGQGDLQQSYLPGTGIIDRTYQAYSAILKADFGGMKLTSITGYNISKLSTVYDRSWQWSGFAQSAYGAGVTGVAYGVKRPMKKLTQELQLAGSFGGQFDWQLGGFYNHEDGPYIVDGETINPTTLQVAGPLLQFTQDRVFEQEAVFAALTYRATERLDIQVGGRISRDDLDAPAYAYVGPFTTLALNRPSPALFDATRAKDSTFTYLLTPRFKVSDDLMVYARFASGYRPGVPNPPATGIPPQSKPDKTQNYELGLKSDFLDHRLSLDASVYYIDWQDIQLSVRDPIRGTVHFANGSGAKSEGVELSISSRPFTGFTASGWVAYNNAVLTEDIPVGPLFGISGNRLPSSAKYSGNVSLQQEFPLFDRAKGYVGADWTYVGDRLSIFRATAIRQELPSYAQTDLRLGMRYDTWSGNLYVNNVTDKRGMINGGLGYLPPTAFVYTQPRTVGLMVSKTF
jgi:outer membrane receptor protein involved in Fe transport